MATVPLPAALLATFAWFAVSHAQYCTPSGPYSAASLNTYPLVNISTVPVPQDYTTASMVNPTSQAVKDYIVKKHNCLRSQVPAANMLAMQWNDEAAVKAQQHANRCVYQHDPVFSRNTSQFSCGQNIAMNTGPGPLSWKTMIDLWYNEVNLCTDAAASSCRANSVIGHYTQATSWQIGCGWTNCGSMNLFVCNYCPMGNVQGQPLYKAGSSCSACPNSCNGKLCTNTCGYTDKYLDCDRMMAPPGKCETGLYKDDCKATCLCNKNAAATTTPTTTTSVTTTTTTPTTTTAKQATVASTTTTKLATTTAAAAPSTTAGFKDLPRPSSFETCTNAYCIAELIGNYQIGQCNKQYCNCKNGRASIADCYISALAINFTYKHI